MTETEYTSAEATAFFTGFIDDAEMIIMHSTKEPSLRGAKCFCGEYPFLLAAIDMHNRVAALTTEDTQEVKLPLLYLHNLYYLIMCMTSYPQQINEVLNSTQKLLTEKLQIPHDERLYAFKYYWEKPRI